MFDREIQLHLSCGLTCSPKTPNQLSLLFRSASWKAIPYLSKGVVHQLTRISPLKKDIKWFVKSHFWYQSLFEQKEIWEKRKWIKFWSLVSSLFYFLVWLKLNFTADTVATQVVDMDILADLEEVTQDTTAADTHMVAVLAVLTAAAMASAEDSLDDDCKCFSVSNKSIADLTNNVSPED